MFSGFATRFTARMTALVLVASMLTGCAEFNRRGGIVAEAEDAVLFVAHTKSHRLFRSYLLAGVLLAAARQGGHNETDRAAIGSNLATVLAVATEAYNCLYPDPNSKIVLVGLASSVASQDAAKNIGTEAAIFFKAPAICQFFDEKMARLDYALFRLALSSLLNPESNSYLADIRDKLIGKIPVLSASAKAAINANKAISEATTIVDDLLNLSFSSAGPVVALLPLYRDSLEINMWVIIDNLTRYCAATHGQPIPPGYENGRPVPNYLIDDANVCKTAGYAKAIMNSGNGYLPDWREFVRTMNYATQDIDAYTAHFYLVTKLLWNSCQNFLASKDSCTKLLENALFHNPTFPAFIQGEGGRIYSAEAPTVSRHATRNRRPPSDTSDPGIAQSPAKREPESTGSINSKPPASPLPTP